MTPLDLGLPRKFTEYRKHQYETAIKAVNSSKRFILVNAPVGAGKSLLNMTASQLTGDRTLYLTSSKGLQDQLTDDFSSIGLFDMRGHGNYPCGSRIRDSISPRNLIPSMEQSDTIGPACYLKPWDCHYQRAIVEACQSSKVISNYAFWLTLERFNKPKAIGDFGLLILDEAHNAEDWLSRYCSFTAVSSDMQLLLQLSLPTAENWVEWVSLAIIRCVEIIASPKTSPKIRTAVTGVYQNLSTIARHVTEVDWIIEGGRDRVKLTPVWAHAYSESYLFRGTSRVLLSSATITRDTARYLGIPKSDYEFIEVPSTFPPERRPFVFVPGCGRIDHKIKSNEGARRFVVGIIDRLIDLGWGRYNGIIQSRSYDWMEYIANNSRHKQSIVTHGRGQTSIAVERFKRDGKVKPLVLVSPAIEEGYDFKNDEARWQVIIKVPFADSRDPVTKARCSSDDGYRNFLAAQSMLQQYGRVTRSKDDWSCTVIFDEHWIWFRNRALFPGYFKVAWKQQSTLPEPTDIKT